MLAVLRVSNIALIESADLTFDQGLHVVTGETGAGKSLLIDALQLVLGARADATLLRTGATRGGAEALFWLHDARPAADWLAEQGFPEADEVVLSRELHENGRSVCRINGQMVTLAQLKAAGELLVDIHGQHEHQSLLHEKLHRGMLDAYMGQSLSPAKQQLTAIFGEYHAALAQLDRTFSSPEERARRKEDLAFAIKDIEQVSPEPGEEETLRVRRQVLRHAQHIQLNLFGAYQQLYEGLGDRRPAAAAQVSQALSQLQEIAEYSPAYAELATRLQDQYYTLEDICLQLRDEKNQLSQDPGELERLENRLAQIHALTRKYGPDVAAILKFYAEAQAEMEALENSEADRERLQKQVDALGERVLEQAEAVSQLRRAGAVALQTAIGQQLATLGLGGAVFVVEVTSPLGDAARLAAVNAGGYDAVAFGMSANAGEAVRPLAKVASGGEVARIMLALKTVLSDTDSIPTLVFDEIDTGVSGRMAQVVAEKLSQLALRRQVFCVSHLTQMAAMADTHWLVAKHQQEGRTLTAIAALDEPARCQQLAFMAAGQYAGPEALAHAQALRAEAMRIRQQAEGATA